MKVCNGKDVTVVQNFPQVKRGDVVQVSRLNLEENTYFYLVSQNPKAFGINMLINLSTGGIWNDNYLWGRLKPSQVKVVDACLHVDE